MAKLTIEIDSNGAALTDPETADMELNSILGKVKAQVYEAGNEPESRPIYDSNGNRIGAWEWLPGETE